jgi:hypothetical protein
MVLVTVENSYTFIQSFYQIEQQADRSLDALTRQAVTSLATGAIDPKKVTITHHIGKGNL